MKRRITITTAIAVIGVLLLPYQRAFAQAPCSSVNPFLYKVEKNGKTSFMLGTMHMGITLSAYPQAVYSAFQNSAIAAFEDDPDEIKKELGPNIRERSKLPPGQTLRDVISATSVQKLESLYGKKTAALIMQYRLWAVKDQIDSDAKASISKREGISWSLDDGIETFLLHQAKQSGKRIELVDLLADSEAAVTAKDLDDLLSYSDPIQHQADCDYSVRAAFCSGSQDLIERYLGSGCETKGMLTIANRRSKNWIPKLTQLFEQGNVFAALGAGHFVGPGGLISLLRQEGFSVTPSR
jgi:uncharacterized protein YbaP (TraB family)